MAAQKCTKCGLFKSLSEFSSNGLGLVKRRCRPCRTEDQMLRYRAMPPEKKQKLFAYIANWCAQNKRKYKRYATAWRLRNRENVNLRTQMRRRRVRGAMPGWANRAAIRAIYATAARLSLETGVQHEVDHIVPLKSNLVCGLHCEANLRVISAIENRRKNNWVWPDMPV